MNFVEAMKEEQRTLNKRMEDIAAQEKRILTLAKRWAKHMRCAEVLSSPSHHLLKAIDKLERIEKGEKR